MAVDISTARIADAPTKQAIDALVRYVNQMEAAYTALKAQVELATPLTLQQIQRELSATGRYPLNVTGLPGTLTQAQKPQT